MKNLIRMTLALLCLTISLFSLAGCQFFDLLRSLVGYDGGEELVPDTSELEELLEEPGSGGSSSPYIGYFTMMYAYDYQSDSFFAESSFNQQIEFRYTGTGDHTQEPYVFLEEFSGTQTSKLAALDFGVHCWTTMVHTVNYRISGSFDPVACSVVLFGIEATPIKSEITETNCPDTFIADLIAPEFYYIPPPIAQNYRFDRFGQFFLIDTHMVGIYELILPTLEMRCPVK